MVTANTDRHRNIGYILTVLGVAGFSAKAIFAKLAYPYGVDPITLMTLRSLFAVPMLWIVFWVSQSGPVQLRGAALMRLFWAGVSGYYLSAFLDFYGLQTVSATLERIILFMYPCFVVILGAFVARRPLSLTSWLALGLAYGGVVVTLAGSGRTELAGQWPGLILILMAAVIFATYYLIAGDLARRLSAIRFSAYVMTIAGGATVAHFLAVRPVGELVQLAGPVYAYAAGLGLVSTVLPVLLITEGLRRIDTSSSATINLLGPVFTVLMAYGILGERLHPAQWLGFAMVLAGVFALGHRLREASRAPNGN